MNAPVRIHRCGPYGPRVIAVAKFLAAEIRGDLIPLLLEVDRRWPGLTARDLIGALVLAEALALETKGTA